MRPLRRRVSESSVRKKSARSRSSRLTTMARGSSYSFANFQTFSVCTCTPATASTTTTAASTTRRPARASAMKSPYPGVSTKLMRWPFQSQYATEVLIDILRLISSGSKSVVVLPSSTLPSRVTAPAVNSRASTREVLPTPPWPTTPTLRIFPISIAIRPASWERAVLGRGPMLPHRGRSDAEGAAHGGHHVIVGAGEVDGRRQRRRVVLDAGAREHQHHARVRRDVAALLEHAEGGHERRALGRRPHALETAEQPLRVLDGALAHRDGIAARVAQDLQHLPPGEGRGHAQPRRVRRRVLPRRGRVGAVVEGLDDGRAALGLLEPHRLLALEAVRLLERREIEPADLRRDLRDDLAGRRDRALDGEDLGARDRGLRDRRGRRAAWHDHRARQPAARGVHGGGAAGVARRGDHEAGRAACSGKRNCHAEAASLERAGGVLALVLAPDVAEPEMRGEPAQGKQRRTPLAQRHRRLVFVERCELAEAVHARRACAQRLLRHVLVHLLEVVAHGEHLSALLADAEHALGVVAVPADRALDVADEAHRAVECISSGTVIGRRAPTFTAPRRGWAEIDRADSFRLIEVRPSPDRR